MEKYTTKKVGLALGGGGAKGLAHIGVIKALENAGIGIDYVAGTSMGALVGGWYAANGDINALETLVLNIKRSDIFPAGELLKRKDGYVFGGKSLAELLEKEFGNIKIEECRIPFAALATAVKTGDEVLIKRGSLTEAIRASIALPIIFPPVELNGELLMDGGLSNPVPADVVKEMGADFIIAVDVSSRWFETPEEFVKAGDFSSIISNSISVIEFQLAKNALKKADLVLRPPVLHYDWLGFGKAREIIKIGEKEIELSLREIRRKTGYKKPPQTLAEKFLDFILNKPQ